MEFITIDEKNSIELKELNETIGRLKDVLKKADFRFIEPEVELKTINGKYYIDKIKLEIIPLKTEREKRQNLLSEIVAPANQEKNLFYAVPIRQLEQPAKKNITDIYLNDYKGEPVERD